MVFMYNSTMNTTKILKKKKPATEYRSTITDLHEKKMTYFIEYYKNLPNKITEFESKKNKLISLENTFTSEYYELKEELEELEKVIHEMKYQTNMTDYLLNVHPIFVKINNLKDKTTQSDKYENIQGDNIIKFVDFKGTKAAASMMDEYLEAIGECSFKKNVNPNVYLCDFCNIDMIINYTEAICICENCGSCKDYSSYNIPQWSDDVEVIQPYLYRRSNHFADHLKRFQAKESKTIPDSLIQSILLELKKRKITDSSSLKPKLLKEILRKIGHSSYYDNINNIICMLSGKKPPKFSKELEDKLIIMFNMIQEPFEKHKDIAGKRSNFPSYPYIIHKMLQILGMKEQYVLEFLPWFPLLKSRDKLYTLDKIWTGITKELGWPMIKSI